MRPPRFTVEKFKFTDTAIRKLPPPPPGKKDYFCFDTETSHFALRVALESKVFYFQNRDEEGTFRKKLGNFPGLTTKAAREIVKGLTGDVARGVDLRAREKAKKAKEAAPGAASGALTLGQLLRDWVSAPSVRRDRYTKTTEADLKRAFGGLLELAIDPAVDGKIGEKIEECLEALADRPAARRVAAQKVRSLCRWAVKRRKISADPTEGIDLGEKSKSRKIFLTGEEARLVWLAAGTMTTPYGQAIRYLLVSGLRLREAIQSRRSEFSPDFSEQSIGGERMKEGEPHVVWLPLAVRQMLSELPRFLNCDLVFTRDGKRPITGFSNLKRQLDKALVAFGGKAHGEAIAKKFRFHDLRRTVTVVGPQRC
jgi:integrase